MTRLLYYEDPIKTEFDASVLEVREAGEKIDLVLDCTLFYPEGGGQPADRGELNGTPVVDVQKSDGVVLHRVPSWDGAGMVRGRIDWGFRYDYMQQHTGQHIISGALYRVAAINTLSVHQGEDYTTIEVDAEAVDEATIEAVEDASNSVVVSNQEVQDIWIDESEAEDYPLRRPPKVSGRLRIVRIGDFDCVACGGVHTLRTADVRLVKHIGTERIRGRTRLYWKIGDRAMADYRLKHGVVAALVDHFSAREDEIVDRARRLTADLADTGAEIGRLVGALGRRIAGSLIAEARSSRGDDGRLVLTARLSEDKRVFRAVLEALAEPSLSGEGVAAALVNEGEDSVQWGIVEREEAGDVAGDSTSRRSDIFGAHKDALLAAVDGRGGGKAPIRQGVVGEAGGVETFLSLFRDIARRRAAGA